MAEKRDFLDELIDLQSDWRSLKEMPNSMMSSLVGEDGERKVFNPADYKEKPFANSSRCLRGASERDDVCARCIEVCPTHAITIHKKSVTISEDCRKCGLCAAVCPTETFSTRRHAPRQVYDQIARAASAYEQCYVTCTRALKRLPNVPAAERGIHVQHRHPGGEILPGLAVVAPQGHRPRRLPVPEGHQLLGHRVPQHGVAGAEDDLLQGVAVGPGPLLPQPAGDLLGVLRRVRQIENLQLVHVENLQPVFAFGITLIISPSPRPRQGADADCSSASSRKVTGRRPSVQHTTLAPSCFCQGV